MTGRTYYSKEAGPQNLYQPIEKELRHNIENWRKIAKAAPTPQRKRYAEQRIRNLERRLLQLMEKHEQDGPVVPMEPGYKLPRNMSRGRDVRRGL